jgi:hypothetical protein
LYLFGAYLRLHRTRTWRSVVAGWMGIGAVALSIVLAFVPGADVANAAAFELKVVGGVVAFMGVGWWLGARAGAGNGVRRSTVPHRAER